MGKRYSEGIQRGNGAMSIPLENGVGDIFLPHLSVSRKGIYRRFFSSSIYHITAPFPCQENFSLMKIIFI
jgi:hypothetical protein